MNCLRCDYPLWRMKSRTCPECGRPFRPSEYRFKPNSVRFCCPHCEQVYYGTSLLGHLVPESFDCVSCHARIEMDEMVLLPAPGVREDQAIQEAMPWIERKKHGAIRGWFKTLAYGMFYPARLTRSMPDEARVIHAVWFMLLTLLIFGAIHFTIGFGFVWFGILMGSAGRPSFGLGLTLYAGAYVAGLALWIFMAHAILVLTGKTRGGMGRTAEAVCYGSGTFAIGAVPFFGWLTVLAVPVWWGVVTVLMIRDRQGVSAWRAVMAAVFPILFTATLAGVGIFMVVSSAIQTAATAAATMTTPSPAEVTPIAEAIIDHADANSQWPAHAIVLVDDGSVTGSQFVTSAWVYAQPQAGAQYPNTTYIDTLLPERLTALVAQKTAAQPQDVLAHRLGDFVFTYHTLDPAERSADLWTVIHWPMVNRAQLHPWAQNQLDTIFVGCADASVALFTQATFDAALADQNQLRSDMGLPPLPHPADVTENAPAVSP